MKIKKFLILVLSCFLLTSCANNETSNKIDLSKAEQIYTSESIPAEDIVAVLGEKMLLHNYDTSRKEYILYDKSTKKQIEYNDDNRCIVSSASIVTLSNGCYTSEVIVDNVSGQETLRIIELTCDGKINILKEMERTEEVSPFIYFAKYNDNNFLLIHKISEETYIDIFNCETKKFSRFLTSKSQGGNQVRLEKVSVFLEQVYVVVYENGQYYLKIYDKNSNLNNTIDLDIPLLQSSPILQFYVINDFLIFENWNSEQALYKLKDNSLQQIEIDNMRIMPAGLTDIFEGELRYIYLKENYDSQMVENSSNKLYTFDLEKEKLKSAEIVKGKNTPLIYGVILCENGDLVLSVKENELSDKTESYLLKNKFLCEIYK